MKCDIVLAGVGGQGILTIAYLLDNAAVNKGLCFKQAEVHGMSQRGGAVYSHLRISDREILSDLVPEGQADMILAVEPLEVQRYLSYLNPKGVVVSNVEPYLNIPNYPAIEGVLGALVKLPKSVLVNAKGIATSAKLPRAENMAMVGAALPFLPFTMDDFEPIISEMFGRKGERVVSGNMEVIKAGYAVGTLTAKLLEKGLTSEQANGLTKDLDPLEIEQINVEELIAKIQ